VPLIVLSFFFAADFCELERAGELDTLTILLGNREQNHVAGDIFSNAVAALKVEHLAGIIILKDS
jgi:hypothetical protein